MFEQPSPETTSQVYRIAILSRGNAAMRHAATQENSRFHRIFEELAALGIAAEPAIYDESFAGDVRAQLSNVDGVLVWVNPLQEGKSRHALDALLSDVAASGPWVSAHPETILAMGTKEVLARTKQLGWGTDTAFYSSSEQLRAALPQRLADGRPRVLKRNRGNDGQGVWKIELVDRHAKTVRIQEASNERAGLEMPIENFFVRCEDYFADGGIMIDQPYQARITEGMIRCYVCADAVAGFAHQYPKGLLLSGHVRPHGDKIMYGPEEPRFQRLRSKMETDWIPQMMRTLELARESLPVIWDADFLLRDKDASGEDNFVLCEINVSSVFAIPDEAASTIAREALRRTVAIRSSRLT
jgi:hypothetical protein